MSAPKRIAKDEEWEALAVRFTKEQLQYIKEDAKFYGISKAAVVRIIVAKAMDSHG